MRLLITYVEQLNSPCRYERTQREQEVSFPVGGGFRVKNGVVHIQQSDLTCGKYHLISMLWALVIKCSVFMLASGSVWKTPG